VLAGRGPVSNGLTRASPAASLPLAIPGPLSAGTAGRRW